MSASPQVVRRIISSTGGNEDLARRRHQNPKLHRSTTIGGKNDRWYFKAWLDVRVGPGITDRVYKTHEIGFCSEMGIREAQRKMAEMVAVINAPREVLQSQVRFGEVTKKWFELADVRPQTLHTYRAVVDKNITPRWGDVRMCDIRPLVVEEWVQQLARTLAESSVTQIRRIFSQIWKCALLWEYTSQANPMTLVRKPRNYGKAGNPKRIPTIEQFHKLLAEMRPHFRPLVLFCVGTGMRISEVLAVRWRQMGGEYLEVEATRDQFGNLGTGKTKNSARMIPIRHINVERPVTATDEDFVFGTNYQAVQHEIRRAAIACGFYFRGLSTHTFRRMHNTWFRRSADGRVDLAQKQLGHADRTTNDGYYVPDEWDLLQRRDIVERFMGKVMGGVQ